MLLSVVVPAYNEERDIRTTLKRILAVFRKHEIKGEIIVVDSSSTDRTREIVRDVIAAHKNVKLFVQHGGKAKAVKLGLKKSKGRIIGFIDSDGEFPPESIPRFLDVLKKFDVAIARRANKRREKQRAIATRIFNTFFSNFLLSLPFRDTQAGMKFFRRAVFEKVKSKLEEKNWAFDVEFLFYSKKCGFSIVEVDVEYGASKGKSKVSFSTVLDLLRASCRLFLERFSGK